MKEFRFQTIQQYADYRAAHCHDAWRWTGFALSMAALIGLMIWSHQHRGAVEETGTKTVCPAGEPCYSWETGNTFTFDRLRLQTRAVGVRDMEPGNALQFSEAQYALTQAVAAWREALHDPSLKRPKLASGWCTDIAIACAETEDYRIVFQGWGAEKNARDLKTILMHEMGHLLGVPHIENDPLMAPAYDGKELSAPTVRAIALAKLHLKLREQPDPQ